MKAKNKLITKLLIKICVFCKVLVVSLQKKEKKKKMVFKARHSFRLSGNVLHCSGKLRRLYKIRMMNLLRR